MRIDCVLPDLQAANVNLTLVAALGLAKIDQGLRWRRQVRLGVGFKENELPFDQATMLHCRCLHSRARSYSPVEWCCC